MPLHKNWLRVEAPTFATRLFGTSGSIAGVARAQAFACCDDVPRPEPHSGTDRPPSPNRPKYGKPRPVRFHSVIRCGPARMAPPSAGRASTRPELIPTPPRPGGSMGEPCPFPEAARPLETIPPACSLAGCEASASAKHAAPAGLKRFARIAPGATESPLNRVFEQILAAPISKSCTPYASRHHRFSADDPCRRVLRLAQRQRTARPDHPALRLRHLPAALTSTLLPTVTPSS